MRDIIGRFRPVGDAARRVEYGRDPRAARAGDVGRKRVADDDAVLAAGGRVREYVFEKADVRLGKTDLVRDEDAVKIAADAQRVQPAVLRGGRAVGDEIYLPPRAQRPQKLRRARQQVPRRAEGAEIPPVDGGRVRLHPFRRKKAGEPLDDEAGFGHLAPLVRLPQRVVDGAEFFIVGSEPLHARPRHRLGEALARGAQKIQDGLVRVQKIVIAHRSPP